MRFQNKKVLVTGAASGIGRATAILFAREGATVTIGDINAQGLAETAALMATAPKIQTYNAADAASCRALVDVAAADGLDVLCNVAGILKWGSSQTFAVEDMDLVMRVNATSVFALCQAAFPHLLKTKGNIVNTASSSGLIGMPYTVAYSASKHAVIGITKGLAVEWAATGVRVNGVCPGQVNTPMTATVPEAGAKSGDIDFSLMMRAAPKLENGACEPEDIAESIAWLASNAARKVTGTLLAVDGGHTAG